MPGLSEHRSGRGRWIAAAAMCWPGVAAAAGMPQLDFANPLTTSQVVWGVVIFILLYVTLSRWALPQVGAVLDQRAASIEADLGTARAVKSTADAAIVEMTTAIERARAEAQTAINTAVDHAKQAAAVQAAEQDARLEAQLRAAEASIGAARAAAMGALRQVATDTATAILGKLTGRAPDPQRLAGAVGAALTAQGQG